MGILCFLAALIAGVFNIGKASADNTPTAIKGTPLVVPAAVLGLSNPYIVRAALPAPKMQRFELSEDLRSLARRVDKLARFGLDLNRRKPQVEKLQLRFQSRHVGGVLQLTYRH